MDFSNRDVLVHYGMPRRSGRYPWGSGENPYQHTDDFLSRIEKLKEEGLTDTEIAKSLNITTTQYRVKVALAKDERRAKLVAQAEGLRQKGYSLDEIAKEMGYKNDSSVRSLLNEKSKARMNEARATAEFLKQQVNEKGMIDVGVGVERELGISSTKLEQALYILEEEGYPVYGNRVPQATNPGKQTTLKVLCPPGTEHKEIYKYGDIHSVVDYTSRDGGKTFDTFQYPASLDSSRLDIRYAEDGGKEKDGVIEIRRGVEDLSLGNAHYAQVRILVDGNKYLKGMAVYSDDLPEGIDIRFNTNKSKSTPKMEVLKDAKEGPNPFGSYIKPTGQSTYIDKNGEEKLSLINKRADEGDWGEWSDSLPSQFLAKQPLKLIHRQLDIAKEDKKNELKEIMRLTNPTVKKAMLDSFANDCDAAAVHLQAASLPRQKYQVILPIKSMGENEVYAPNYRDGEKVALIRFPHAGTFEIPILTVNNKKKEAIDILGKNPNDAVGINSKVAERLSGADFDGDTVMVIPTGRGIDITSTPALKGLKDFDPKMEYGGKEKGTFKEMKNTNLEMGKISNLITDMTIKGATPDELARAVRHSMVVIDAEKHHLDYKQSEIDNGIAALRQKYQGRVDPDGKYHEGASTLISQAKSPKEVTKRKGTPKIDPDTGELIFKEVHETYLDKNGKIKERTQSSTKMAEVKDAYELSSGSQIESAYAEYANSMKALANEARKELVSTGNIKYEPSARILFQDEVDSLNAKLAISEKNAPRERQAQVIAKSQVDAIKKENPDLTKKEIQKYSQMALTDARVNVGAERHPIEITDKEWDAIQSGAISENTLSKILNYTDIDVLRQRATPRDYSTLSEGQVARLNSMASSGNYTNMEIANALGVSSTTISNYLKEKSRNE